MAACLRCNGIGRVDCLACDGTGEFIPTPDTDPEECEICEGDGDRPCPECQGAGSMLSHEDQVGVASGDNS